MSWTDYNEKSWEYQAGKTLTEMRCDGPFRNVKNGMRELYDSEQFDALARKAMAAAGGSEGTWTIEDQVQLLASKQHDYGHANIDKFGGYGVLVRLWDKISRYENLMARQGDSPSHESIQDTLVDIVGYCAIHRMVLTGVFSFPLDADIKEVA